MGLAITLDACLMLLVTLSHTCLSHLLVTHACHTCFYHVTAVVTFVTPACQNRLAYGIFREIRLQFEILSILAGHSNCTPLQYRSCWLCSPQSNYTANYNSNTSWALHCTRVPSYRTKGHLDVPQMKLMIQIYLFYMRSMIIPSTTQLVGCLGWLICDNKSKCALMQVGTGRQPTSPTPP